MLTEGGDVHKPDRTLPPFETERLEVVDWTGVNMGKESLGAARDPETVQTPMIDVVSKEDDWDLILADDGSGEVADIVAIREEENKVSVLLVHCKYSHEAKAGARVIDLYEVCG